MARWRRTGSRSAHKMGGVKPSPLAPHTDFLLALIAAEDDLTLEQIRGRLQERGVVVGYGSVWRFFDRHRISVKKNRSRRRATAA